jgi:N-acetylglucosaminyl-diphospho-decaprenol L-rhamnosyltransferase
VTDQQPDWDRITIISIVHHSAAVIGQCMENFRDVPNIVIIDNASDDETLDIIAATVPQAQIVRNKHGVGYGNAANQGMELVKTEFAMMVNPDSIVTGEAVCALLAVADTYPEAGIICPQSLNRDGSVEPTHDVNLFKRKAISPPYHRRDHEPAPQGLVCAEYISGAVNLFRMTILRDVGIFDPNLFLYFEDDDISLRMHAAGHAAILVADARIMHVNAGSVRPSLHYKWEKFWHYGWSRLYIEQKYHGRGAMLGLAVRHTGRFFFKALLYSLIFQGNKALRDWARLVGTLEYLIGRPAFDPRFREINENWRKTLKNKGCIIKIDW